MTIKEWLATPHAEGWTVPKLAEACGVTLACVYGWISGHGLPLLQNFVVLERLSEGRIKVSSLVHAHHLKDLEKAHKALEAKENAA